MDRDGMGWDKKKKGLGLKLGRDGGMGKRETVTGLKRENGGRL